MDPIKVVVRFLDGRLLKGYLQNFNPANPSFYLLKDAVSSPGNQPLQVNISDIKGVFFVKTHEGNKDYRERKNFMEGDRAQSRKAEVTFADGEVIQGSVVGYDPHKPGFFLMPIDAKSNNTRIFVVAGAVKDFRFI